MAMLASIYRVRHQKFWCMVALAGLGILCISVYPENLFIAPIRQIPKNVTEPHIIPKLHTNKIILGWNKFDHKIFNMPQGDVLFKNLKCKVNNCYLTTDKELFNQSDAVLFLVGKELPQPPLQRPNYNQRWVFLLHESPMHGSSKYFQDPVYRQQFNWTMTYRLDSDFYFPFGCDWTPLYGKKDGSKRDLLSAINQKPKGIAWFVSHCPTKGKREKYVKQLQEYIPVDIYGDCGPTNLTGKLSKRRLDYRDIRSMNSINETYLFYLAFENSLCVDYITEKFFKVLPYDIIPIVRGGADYSKVVPHKWFINTNEFASPKDLAQYIYHLQKHPDEAVKYLEKRDKYNFQRCNWNEMISYCDLCEKLNNPEEPPHVYNDIYQWWVNDACVEPNDF